MYIPKEFLGANSPFKLKKISGGSEQFCSAFKTVSRLINISAKTSRYLWCLWFRGYFGGSEVSNNAMRIFSTGMKQPTSQHMDVSMAGCPKKINQIKEIVHPTWNLQISDILHFQIHKLHVCFAFVSQILTCPWKKRYLYHVKGLLTFLVFHTFTFQTIFSKNLCAGSRQSNWPIKKRGKFSQLAVDTLPKTNNSPLKMMGFQVRNLPFPGVYFHGIC